MSDTPPPYTDITGISRAVMKDNAQVTLAIYDGNARPGELVVNLEIDPPALYIGNNLGQLTAISTIPGPYTDDAAAATHVEEGVCIYDNLRKQEMASEKSFLLFLSEQTGRSIS